MPAKQCRCGSGERFDTCCGPYLAGLPAPTAEALMRSRYTAFAHGDGAYIARTTAPEHRDSADTDLPAVTWVGLKINGTSGGGVADATGTVDFTARFKDQSDGGATRVHRENSRFRREDGLWVYVDGAVATTPVGKTGRNDPCPCESGKKFKRCCGK
ncbi:MAG: YchJ family protein [Alphaproteobacteria bacterium]|nr:YchJ family protein [Alphaproteobacteria bacterium]